MQRKLCIIGILSRTHGPKAHIGSIGHFDVTVEEINGSIVGLQETCHHTYSSWSQLFSADTEFQNTTSAHHAWVTSPVIDLRPNVNGRALLFNLTSQVPIHPEEN